jgi:hypothetical protein
MRDASLDEDAECLPGKRPVPQGVPKVRPTSRSAHAHKIELRIPVAVVARWAYQQFIEADREPGEDRSPEEAATRYPMDD